jgi:L-histidine N-alpha-methyltransferase
MPFADDVRAGLTAHPKTLPPKYFYDELGSRLFEAIAALPEYYLTRAEAEIFAAHATDIVRCAKPRRLIELGSGSATKTRFLINAALREGAALEYDAIDISGAALQQSSKALQAEYPGLRVRSYQGEYFEGLQRLAHGEDGALATLVLFLGSNIGNFDPSDAERFLRAISAVLRAGDGLLLGTDLRKDRRVLEAAYDDELKVTAAFNKNILVRINRELGGHFVLHRFDHRAFYNERAGRVEMHLESRVAQNVRIDKLDAAVDFAAGETIHTESSYKFTLEQVAALAQRGGLVLERSWTDASGRFASNLLRKR